MYNEEKYKIILASNSPRRKEILEKAGYTFQIFVPKGQEYDIIGMKYRDELVEKCAELKAKNGYDEISKTKVYDVNEIVIVGCDTVVVNDGIILGKPKDKDDAFTILKNLSGKTHEVVTAISLIKNNICKTANEKTEISFRELTDADINNYIERCRPFDKAGSYGIQDENFDFAIKVDGNVDNVIGFPMETFERLLGSI